MQESFERNIFIVFLILPPLSVGADFGEASASVIVAWAATVGLTVIVFVFFTLGGETLIAKSHW